MSLANEIKAQDRNYLLQNVYFTDTGESESDLAQAGKVRVKYNGGNYLMSAQSNFKGFNTNRFNTIKNYLKAHTKIIYSYAGTAGTSVDPLVTFVGQISTFTYNPPSFMSSSTDLVTHITSLLNSAIIQDASHQVYGLFKFRQMFLGSIPAVADYATNVEVLGTAITTAITTAINIPTTAVHGVFTGPATMVSIIVT